MSTIRRNGQLSSCEPCRKSKLRCDHATPVCGRCVRRDRQHLCVYHPAPLTQPTIPREGRKRRPTTEVNLHDDSDQWSQKKTSVSTPGFLGNTSYSDVFTDHGSDLSIGSLSSSKDPVPVDSQRIQLGARALLLLKYLPMYRAIITARFKVWKGWTLGWPVTNMVLTTTEEMWDAITREETDESQRALLLSKRLFEKHTRPIEIHPAMSWAEFASATTGRWETIGLLFTTVGLSLGFTSSEDSMFKQNGWAEAKSVAVTATAVADLCLQFCDSAGIINDLVCSLLLQQTSLLTTVYGESDYRPWRRLGELTTAVFALGLHQESTNCPFFIREMRKRTMVGAYTADKILATFLGRPPLISWRYCDIPMPLDLSFEEIASEPAVRDTAIANISPDGWNREGSLKKGAYARVALLTSILREKILGLSLSRSTDNLAEQIEELSQESHKLYHGLPSFLHWHPESNLVSRVDDHLLFEFHLDFLYNDFLLYRLLAKRTQTQPDGMISTALEILNALLSMVAKANRYRSLGWAIAWSLCYAGLPSAGVLSADLLRRSRLRMPESTIFPRSEIIQKLSIFASHLDTMIQPDEGNHQIAQQGRRAIRHVLDQVLSVHSVSDIPSGSSSALELDPKELNLVSPDLLDSIDVDDRRPFLDWLDGTDSHEPWLTWMNFS